MDMILTRTPQRKETTHSLLDVYTIYYEELPRPERVTRLQKARRWFHSLSLNERQRSTMHRLVSS